MPYDKMLDEDYEFPFKGEDKTTKTSWYMVGVVIGFFMSFLVFLIYYIRHSNINIKGLLNKI